LLKDKFYAEICCHYISLIMNFKVFLIIINMITVLIVSSNFPNSKNLVCISCRAEINIYGKASGIFSQHFSLGMWKSFLLHFFYCSEDVWWTRNHSHQQVLRKLFPVIDFKILKKILLVAILWNTDCNIPFPHAFSALPSIFEELVLVWSTKVNS